MADEVKCWEFFNCREESCPVYQTEESLCWLVSGTHSRGQVQGRFLEKMEVCLDCPVFKKNIGPAALPETLALINRQFQDITRELRQRNQEGVTHEKLRSLGVLAGSIAHDFNNLLTGIFGNISLARVLAHDREDIGRRLAEAEKAAGLAKDLAQRLLTFSRGGAPVKTTAVIDEFVRDW